MLLPGAVRRLRSRCKPALRVASTTAHPPPRSLHGTRRAPSDKSAFGNRIAGEFDVVFSDVDDQRLESELGVKHQSPAAHAGSFPARGVIYGPNLRVFVPMVVSNLSKSTMVHVVFLYASSSPFTDNRTYLSRDTLKALGADVSFDRTEDVLINGERVSVSPSRDHFRHVDFLGYDLLEKIGGKVMMSYGEGTFELHKQN